MGDRLGIFFSSLCFCHCIVTPLFIMFAGASAMGSFLSSEWVHKALLIPVLLMALATLPKAWYLTRDRWILSLATVGLSAMLGAMLFHGAMEVVLTVFGSVSLIIAHRKSLKLQLGKLQSPSQDVQQGF